MKSTTRNLLIICMCAGIFLMGLITGRFILLPLNSDEVSTVILENESIEKEIEVEKEDEEIEVEEHIRSRILYGIIIKQEYREHHKNQYITIIKGQKTTTIIIGKQFKKVKEEGEYIVCDKEIWLNTEFDDKISVIYNKEYGEYILKGWTVWEE